MGEPQSLPGSAAAEEPLAESRGLLASGRRGDTLADIIAGDARPLMMGEPDELPSMLAPASLPGRLMVLPPSVLAAAAASAILIMAILAIKPSMPPLLVLGPASGVPCSWIFTAEPQAPGEPGMDLE